MNRKKIILFFLCLLSVSLSAQEQLSESFPKGSLNLRTNVVPWLTLMPNVGVEYKIKDRVGLLIDGGWMHWNFDTRDKYWRAWNISPQVRYYTGANGDSYIGAKFIVGEYNLLGEQANFQGGGLSLGHQFYCGKNLSVDIGIALGYARMYNREKYERVEYKNKFLGKKPSRNYWGPIGANITFVWRIN